MENDLIRQMITQLKSVDTDFQFWSAMICVLLLTERNIWKNLFGLVFWCLMPISAIFQLYHGDQF
jgi:hypothetical protein